MAIPTRATSHGTFFITIQTHDRRRLFQVQATAELFLETLQHYRHEGHYKAHLCQQPEDYPYFSAHRQARRV
jgi:hypothetical protein